MQTILPQSIGNDNPIQNDSDLPVIFEELEPLEIDPSLDYIFDNLYNPRNKTRTQSIDLVLHNSRYYARKTILYRERRFEPTHLYNIHHRNIEHCLEFGVDEDNKYAYLYLEYMPNGNLASKIVYLREKNIRLSEPIIFNYVLDLVEGLYYLHTENIIHRHIKPGNILIGRYNELVYCGFGFCCDSTDESTFSNNFNNNSNNGVGGGVSDEYLIGTGNYWSPETIKTKTYGFESDIFSLGCVIYELYTTNVLFPGNSIDEVKNRILFSNPQFDYVVMNRIPKLEELIGGMTDKNAMSRYKFNNIYKCLDEWSRMSKLNIIVRNPLIIEEMNSKMNNNNNNNNSISQTVRPVQPIQSVPIYSNTPIPPPPPQQNNIVNISPYPIPPQQSPPLQPPPPPFLQQQVPQQQQQQNPKYYSTPISQTPFVQPYQPPQSPPFQPPLPPFQSTPILKQQIPLLIPPPQQQQHQQHQNQQEQFSSNTRGVYNTQLPHQNNNLPIPISSEEPSPPQQQQQQQQVQSDRINQQPMFSLPNMGYRDKTIIPSPIIPVKQ